MGESILEKGGGIMSLKLYFVRHGQSEANLSDLCYDDSEAELTMYGKGQAVGVGKELKEMNIGFTAIYCSPYTRAHDTCSIALQAAGLKDRKVIYDDRLIERRFDGLFGKTFDEEVWKGLCTYDSDTSETLGVETLDELERRARSFIDEMRVKYPVGNILVFSHGMLGIAMHTAVYGRPDTNTTFGVHMLKNCEIEILELK